MKLFGDSLEIVDTKQFFVGSDIKIRPGLTTWKIFTEDKADNANLIEIKNTEDPLYAVNKEMIDASCFAKDEETSRLQYKLQNCIRLFPHDSDTSGFFITLIRKIKPLDFGSDKPKKMKENKPINPDKGVFYLKDSFAEANQWLIDYYGLNNFPFDQLVTHSKIAKKVNFISKGVNELLSSDKRNQLKLISVGVKLFSNNKAKCDDLSNFCRYRICQDGMMYLIPFMTKRIFFCTEEFFIRILKEVDIKHNTIEDEKLRENLHSLKSGCVVLVCLKNKIEDFSPSKYPYEEYLKILRENFSDALCCYNSAVRVSSMINKEHQHVFNLKYNIDVKK